ncbi:MAG: hypothetical protein C4575_09540 [Desulforudis sp.]|nr:MAG: hypothetical protein C4575_09540 [Desulforudis sp.]
MVYSCAITVAEVQTFTDLNPYEASDLARLLNRLASRHGRSGLALMLRNLAAVADVKFEETDEAGPESREAA